MDNQISRMRELLRQWRRAYLDDIDDYDALNRATDATTLLLGDRHPQDYEADPSLPMENSPDSAIRKMDDAEKSGVELPCPECEGAGYISDYRPGMGGSKPCPAEKANQRCCVVCGGYERLYIPVEPVPDLRGGHGESGLQVIGSESL